MSMHRQTLEGYRGLTLCADCGGPTRGLPVILLHGGGQTRHSWSRAATQLAAAGYRTLALDLRGHGESDWPADQDYSTDAFVADLKAVIATLPRPPVLVGASLGGACSLLALGESATPLASALVLVDVVPRMSPAGVKHIRDFMVGSPNGFATLQEAADAVSRYLPNRPRPPTHEGLLKNLRLKENGRYYWHWDPAFQANGARERLADLHSRMETAASKVKVPTLLIRGRQSDVVSEHGAQSLLALMPHAEYVDVDGAGHMVAGDRNDVFNQAIAGFLARQPR